MERKKRFLEQLKESRKRFSNETSPDFTIDFHKPKGRLRPRESNQIPTGFRKDIKVRIGKKLS